MVAYVTPSFENREEGFLDESESWVRPGKVPTMANAAMA